MVLAPGPAGTGHGLEIALRPCPEQPLPCGIGSDGCLTEGGRNQEGRTASECMWSLSGGISDRAPDPPTATKDPRPSIIRPESSFQMPSSAGGQ